MSVRWTVPAALGLAPLVLGILVAFSADHSPRYGFVIVSILAGATALASILVALTTVGAPRGIALAKIAGGAVLSAIAIGAAIDVPSHGDERNAFDLQVAVVAVLGIFGLADLITGIIERREDRFRRDWLTLGVLELLAGVVAIVVPSGYRLDYTVTDKSLPPVSLTLDAAVMVVGLLGAALAVIGVYLAIAAVSLMGRQERAAKAETSA